jgi:hypothetical protein
MGIVIGLLVTAGFLVVGALPTDQDSYQTRPAMHLL